MTPQELASATGARLELAKRWLSSIESAMAEFEINTPKRQAAFLAQIGHESGGLRWTVEIWVPTPAQRRYEGRADLGNEMSGDGFKYRGRGLIQITGRANYRSTGSALGIDLVARPERLAEPVLAARSAGWFWRAHGLNELADVGAFMRITRRINGGTHGYAHRLALFEVAQQVLI